MGLSKDEVIELARRNGILRWDLKVQLTEEDAIALEVIDYIVEKHEGQIPTKKLIHILLDCLWWVHTLASVSKTKDLERECEENGI